MNTATTIIINATTINTTNTINITIITNYQLLFIITIIYYQYYKHTTAMIQYEEEPREVRARRPISYGRFP